MSSIIYIFFKINLSKILDKNYQDRSTTYASRIGTDISEGLGGLTWLTCGCMLAHTLSYSMSASITEQANQVNPPSPSEISVPTFRT